ncbi:MAG: TonB-dependent receptor [bacterium]|nr:TonB-dependent receptor [bacterium]
MDPFENDVEAFEAEVSEELDLTELSLEALMNMDAEVTSVSRHAESLASSAAAAYVLTEEDIRRSGATSIMEALRMVPGLQVARTGSSAWAISARGFNAEFADKMLVLIDGRSVYTQLFAGTLWADQDLMLEDVARIEVIRGPGAALWGANAVNGVINIITKPAEQTQGNLATLLLGQEDKWIAGLRAGAPLGDSGFVRAYSKYARRDGFEAEGLEVDEGWSNTRGGFRADWTVDDNDAFTLQGDVYSGVVPRQVTVPETTPPGLVTRDLDSLSEGGNLLGRWTRSGDDGTSLSLQLYYDRRELETYLLEDRRDTVDLDFQHRALVTERHDLTWGLGYRRVHADTFGSDVLSFAEAHRTDDVLSAFVQDRIHMTETVDLIVGTKLEHNSFTGFEVQPNVRVVWQQDEQRALWGSISRAVRTPSQVTNDVAWRQALIPDMGSGFDTLITVLGDDDFDSEELVASELGYRIQLTENLSLDVATFFNDYRDLQTLELGELSFLAPGLVEQALVYDNEAEAETYGVEIATQWNVTGDWTLHASYSLLRLDIDASDSTNAQAEVPEDESPRNQAHIRSFYDLTETWELDAALYYVDHLSGGVDSYVRGDIRVGWNPNDSTRFSIGAQGLLHDDEEEFGTGPFGPSTPVESSVFVSAVWSF